MMDFLPNRCGFLLDFLGIRCPRRFYANNPGSWDLSESAKLLEENAKLSFAPPGYWWAEVCQKEPSPGVIASASVGRRVSPGGCAVTTLLLDVGVVPPSATSIGPDIISVDSDAPADRLGLSPRRLC
jgi:hypothetical protein